MNNDARSSTYDLETRAVISELKEEVYFRNEAKERVTDQIAELQKEIQRYEIKVAHKADEIDENKAYIRRRSNEEGWLKKNGHRHHGYVREVELEIEPLRAKIARANDRIMIHRNTITAIEFQRQEKRQEIRQLENSLISS